jgi:hypothetical protein
LEQISAVRIDVIDSWLGLRDLGGEQNPGGGQDRDGSKERGEGNGFHDMVMAFQTGGFVEVDLAFKQGCNTNVRSFYFMLTWKS